MITIKNNLWVSKQKIKELSLTKLKKQIKSNFPAFISYKPGLRSIKAFAQRYARFKNLIIIGYGGSNTSFLALYKALYSGNKNVEILNTVDPYEIRSIKKSYNKKDTLVIAISKSGKTLGVIETLMSFMDYKGLVITETDSFLHRLSMKISYDFYEHPPIGGRFSARTPTTYLPLAILGININKIEQGFAKGYYEFMQFNLRNKLLALAISLAMLEKEQNITEIYMPIYSKKLMAFSNLIIQLIHESSCKDGKGQTIYTAEAPEAQHHTNQRVFGGRKNLAVLFLTLDEHNIKERIKVPKEISMLGFKGFRLGNLKGLSYADALHYEFLGTYKNAITNLLPTSWINLSKIDEFNAGLLISVFQVYAVLASELRHVNPYNQPHVENSKKITLNLVNANR